MQHATPEERLLDLIKKAQGSLKIKRELKIFTKVNIILICIIVVIVAIFLADVSRSNKGLEDLKTELSELDTKSMPQPVEPVEAMPEAETPLPSPKIGQVVIENPAEGLSLLGIIIGDDNQAVIEDKKSNRTFFLYKGDRFREFTVVGISDSGVVLDHKGEKIELNM